MKQNRNRLLLLLTAVLITAMMTTSVFAESSNGSGSCYFNGEEIVSDFSSGTIADSVSNLQPGDDVTFTVEYTNKDSHDTDWYMETSILRTLEKTDAARKTVEGTGTAENGGYTYELIHTDSEGKDTVLFSNDKVGGESKAGGMEGLEQATNALDDWFYLETLGEGESGSLTLNVAFEGETEVNDYMDTSGSMDIRFAVELTRKDATPDKDKDKDKKDKPGKKGSSAYTGDNNDLFIWTAVCASAAILLLILAFISIRRDRKEAESNEEA